MEIKKNHGKLKFQKLYPHFQKNLPAFKPLVPISSNGLVAKALDY